MDDHEHGIPDSIPTEWLSEDGTDQRTITVQFNALEAGMVMLLAMKVSLKHSFHGCPQEVLADELVEKIHDAVESQIKGL